MDAFAPARRLYAAAGFACAAPSAATRSSRTAPYMTLALE